jgi:hypothetical protein
MESDMHYLKTLYPTLDFGTPIHIEGLTITPISSAPIEAAESDLSHLLDIHTAFEKGLVSIKEIGESGSVQEVIVFNNADRPLILLEGQGLEGAKQNRVLQKTVIIPANRSLTVPVNCVERGRWNYNSDEFKPAKFSAGPSVKMRKASAMKEGSYNVQSEVWAGVSEMSERYECHSVTEDMVDVLSQASTKERYDHLEAERIIEGFSAYGYKVTGGQFEFIELFGCKSWAKEGLKRSLIEWIMDARYHDTTKPLTLSILDSDWVNRSSIGLETHWLAMTECTGLSSEYEEKLLHLFCAPNQANVQRRRRLPIFDVE